MCSHLHTAMANAGADLVAPQRFSKLEDSNQYAYNGGLYYEMLKMYAGLAYMEAGMDVSKLSKIARDFEDAPSRKDPSVSNYDYNFNIINSFYKVLLEDLDQSTAWGNLSQYFTNVFAITDQDKYRLNCIHYNLYNTPIQQLIPGSKMINLYTDQTMFLNCSLLFIFKRLQLQKQSTINLINQDPDNYDYLLQWNKDHLNKIVIQRDYSKPNSIVRQGELVIDIKDLYFDLVNFDEEISDYIGHQVALDYQKIADYNQKNSQLMLDNFGIVYGNNITKEQVYEAGVEYIDNFFQTLNS